jgi:hypothetical protein
MEQDHENLLGLDGMVCLWFGTTEQTLHQLRDLVLSLTDFWCG